MEKVKKNRAVMNDLRHRQPWPLSTKEPCTRCPCRLHVRPAGEENDPALRNNSGFFKKAMTEKNERWKSREWHGSTRTRWQQPAESSGGQSSVYAWEHAKPKGKWMEVSADNRVLEALVKEKKITWNKSGKESAKREADLYDMLEKAATNEKREGRDG